MMDSDVLDDLESPSTLIDLSAGVRAQLSFLIYLSKSLIYFKIAGEILLSDAARDFKCVMEEAT